MSALRSRRGFLELASQVARGGVPTRSENGAGSVFAVLVLYSFVEILSSRDGILWTDFSPFTHRNFQKEKYSNCDILLVILHLMIARFILDMR